MRASKASSQDRRFASKWRLSRVPSLGSVARRCSGRFRTRWIVSDRTPWQLSSASNFLLPSFDSMMSPTSMRKAARRSVRRFTVLLFIQAKLQQTSWGDFDESITLHGFRVVGARQVLVRCAITCHSALGRQAAEASTIWQFPPKRDQWYWFIGKV